MSIIDMIKVVRTYPVGAGVCEEFNLTRQEVYVLQSCPMVDLIGALDYIKGLPREVPTLDRYHMSLLNSIVTKYNLTPIQEYMAL